MPADRRRGPTAPWSLRRRLLLLTALGTLAAWIVGGFATYVVSTHQAATLDDEQMTSVAHTLLTLADHEIDEIRAEGKGRLLVVDEDSTTPRRYLYQIWSPQPPAMLLTNGQADAGPLASFEQQGLQTQNLGGEDWRTSVVWSEDRTKVILIAEPIRLRETFPKTSLVTLFAFFLASLGALLGLLAWMIGHATRSLRDSAAQLAERTPRDLRPIEVTAPPQEVMPLVGAINALFERFDKALEAERRFTSAAAHELRTPLAAVKVHAQVAQLTRTAAERKEAMGRLLLAIDRAARMIDQLLTLSRLDGILAMQTSEMPLRLDIIASHVIEEVRPLLERRKQTIDARMTACEIEGMEFGVASLLRNLIDNSMRYAPPSSAIRVTVAPVGGRCVATVEDSGPGIPPQERDRVFDRFYRLSSDGEGCGIGLSIVRNVAQVHRATIELGESDLGGLRVSVAFPPRPGIPPLPLA
jgi:two-component system, OmpR family, sensor histidine kinase QseC